MIKWTDVLILIAQKQLRARFKLSFYQQSRKLHMKKTLIYRCLPMFAFFLILISVFIAAWCSFFYAQFVLDASDVFFGLVPPNSQVTKVARFFNRGNKALQIKRVFVGCGCIEVSLSDRCIPP